MNNKNKYIDLIEYNIEKYGYHLYLISDNGPLPRISYSIGLKEKLNFELILAGALLFNDEEIKIILDEIIIKLRENRNINSVITSLGKFHLKKVNATWVNKLMLGALDYYNIDDIETLQVLPSKEYMTIDIPVLSKEYNPEQEPIWKWLTIDWIYTIPTSSTCVTNTEVLYGKQIIQAIRWEEDYWEAFSKLPSQIIEQDTKLIPLSIILENNNSNKIIATLLINQAVSRIDITHEWEVWNVND